MYDLLDIRLPITFTPFCICIWFSMIDLWTTPKSRTDKTINYYSMVIFIEVILALQFKIVNFYFCFVYWRHIFRITPTTIQLYRMSICKNNVIYSTYTGFVRFEYLNYFIESIQCLDMIININLVYFFRNSW